LLLCHLATLHLFGCDCLPSSIIIMDFIEELGQGDLKKGVSMTEAVEQAPQEKQGDDENKLCPLFMDGLPTDFSTNPGLAAIASLLDEESDEVATKREYDAPPTMAGGGKVRRKPARCKRKDGRPYDMRHRESKAKAASIGETHLFLKMWKL